MNQHASKTIGEKPYSRGRFAEGEPRGHRVWASPAPRVRSEPLGLDRAATLADAFAYAPILDDFEEFEPIYRQALSVFEGVYGSELLEIAVNLNRPAAYRRALAMKKNRCGPEHSSDRALMAVNYALLLFELGRLEAERRLAAHALARRRGQTH